MMMHLHRSRFITRHRHHHHIRLPLQQQQYRHCIATRSVHTTKYYDVTVVDVETTGLSSVRDRLLEVAAVRLVDGLTVAQFSSLMNPVAAATQRANDTVTDSGNSDDMSTRLQELIPQQVIQLTGINAAMIERAPPAHSVLQMLAQFVHGEQTTLVAHNAKFDIRFIEREMERQNAFSVKGRQSGISASAMRIRRVKMESDGSGVEYEEMEELSESENTKNECGNGVNEDALVGTGGLLCTQQLAKRLFPGLDSYALGALAEQLQIPVPESKLHRAMADVQLTIKVWSRLYQTAAQRLGANPTIDFFHALSAVSAKEDEVKSFIDRYKETMG